MSWFYVVGGAPTGPLEEDEFRQLVQIGTVRPDTLVWREGMQDWVPHARLLDPNAVVPGVPPPLAPVASIETGRCAECGGVFERRDMVNYVGVLVCAGCRDVFFQKVREGLIAPEATTLSANYAGFWMRLAAFVIDSIALGIVGSIINMPLSMLMSPTVNSPTSRGEFPAGVFVLLGATMLVGFLLQVGYRGFMIGRFGATLGKLALSLRVVRPDGGKVSYSRAFGRASAEIVSGTIIYIGYIIAAFDDQKRALHDHICDTRVIKKV